MSNFNPADLSSLAKQFAGGDHNFDGAIQKVMQTPDAAQAGGVDNSVLQACHDAAYNNGPGSNQLDSNAVGGAAALGAIKNFVSGQGGQGQGDQAVVASAMSEAAKLYDQHSAAGNIVQGSGGKDDAIAQAAKTAMSLLQQSGGSGSLLGSAGGLASAENIASKFSQ